MPFDISKLDSQTIIFGGLTLGLLGMILLAFRLVKSFEKNVNTMAERHSKEEILYFNHTNDVIKGNSAALLENAKSNQKLIDLINTKFNKKKK